MRTTRPLDWTDDTFEDAPVINARALAYSGPPLALDEFAPVFMRGDYAAPVFSGWPGVGYSSTPFTMKAYIDGRGNLYRPRKRQGRDFEPVRPGVWAGTAADLISA